MAWALSLKNDVINEVLLWKKPWLFLSVSSRIFIWLRALFLSPVIIWVKYVVYLVACYRITWLSSQCFLIMIPMGWTYIIYISSVPLLNLVLHQRPTGKDTLPFMWLTDICLLGTNVSFQVLLQRRHNDDPVWSVQYNNSVPSTFDYNVSIDINIDIL